MIVSEEGSRLMLRFEDALEIIFTLGFTASGFSIEFTELGSWEVNVTTSAFGSTLLSFPRSMVTLREVGATLTSLT
jgi:hypothetical protein